MSDTVSDLGLAIGSGAPREIEGGWLWCRSRELEGMHRVYAQVLHYIRDVEARAVFPETLGEDTRVLSDPLEECPLPEENAEYYELISRPTSLQSITARVASCEYAEPALFEQDVLQLFFNARKWYGIGTEGYGETVVLQRLYQQLTRTRDGLYDALGTRHIRPRASDIDVVDAQRASADPALCFASDCYGPLVEPPVSSNLPLVSIDHIAFKGRRYAPGDWVHLMNPADPAWPIVAQIYRVYKRRDIPGDFLSACWYYRPAQTCHTANRTFFPNEVFKTGVYGEHAAEDILEDVLVLHHSRYTRARPSAPYWNTEGPVYIVESKYDTASPAFYRIKDWTNCVPEEIKSVVTPMDVFAEHMQLPEREESPLLQSICGRTGKLLEHAPLDDALKEYPDLFADSADSGDSAGEHKADSPVTSAMPPLTVPQSIPRVPPTADLPATHPDRIRAYTAFHSAAHDISLRTSPAGYANLQQELQKRPYASLIEIGALARRLALPETLVASLRDTALAAGVLVNGPPVVQHNGAVSSAAALAANRAEATFSEVPRETREYFQQDRAGKLLWYAAQPLPRTATTIDGTTAMPMPSLTYMEAATGAARTH